MLAGNKLQVHWWHAKRIDGVWSPAFKKPKGKARKGTAGPYVGTIGNASVMDKIVTLRNLKKGKIQRKHLDELIKLAKKQKGKYM